METNQQNHLNDNNVDSPFLHYHALQQSQHLWYQLAMFFRDELLSWSWRRPLGMMPLAPAAGGGSLNPVDFKHKVTNNVDSVISRISGIAPQCFSEEVKVVLTSFMEKISFS